MTPRLGSVDRARIRQAAELARGHRNPAELLYARWYAPSAPYVPRPAELPALGAVFRAARAAAHHPWIEAHTVRHGMAGVIVVRTVTGDVRAVTRGEYVHPDPVSDPDAVLVSPIRGAVVAGGWWRTWGDGWDPARPPSAVSRIYLAVAEGRAPAVVAAATSVLVTTGQPWLLKLGVDPGTLARPDAAVVYVPDDALRPVLAVLETATAGLRGAAEPALARRVGPGLAWAQSPADDRSFGETVCELVAGALVEHPADPIDAVERALTTAGLDPSRPHLRAMVREPVAP